MVDRFQENDKPPIIAGHCSICHDEIQKGYEKHCTYCDEMVCEDCQHECWICQVKGCDWCIPRKDSNGEWICEVCKSNREWLIEQVKCPVDIPGYYCSGESETDEQDIFEFSHNDHPKIEIRINKVKK